MDTSITGAEILVQSLVNHNVNTLFGYPGSNVMIILDRLYDHKDSINHILARHEQGAIHAAQGYAQASKKVGVALLTSGPGATNTVTGIADAMINNTPLVVITGQVHSKLLGTDAFQEVDIISITHSITKWAYQIRSANEISSALAKAFYIASTGCPGPVLLDITKDAQLEEAIYIPQKIDFIQSYNPKIDVEKPEDLSSSFFVEAKNSLADQVIEMVENIDPNLILVLDLEHHYLCKFFNKAIKSEKFGTMGFGLPAAIGAKYAVPQKTVCLIAGNAQLQTTIQELGIIMQSKIDIKIILLNTSSKTKSDRSTPDFIQLVNAYDIQSEKVADQNDLKTEIQKAIQSFGSYFLEINLIPNHTKIPSILA